MIFDLIVIGSGPAGQKAALQGAKAGKKVALVEQHDELGGGCVHSGTLPSKSFRESVYRWSLSSRGATSSDLDNGAKAPKKGPLPDMKRLLKRRDRVVKGETQVIRDQLERNGISVYCGKARVVSPNEVEVVSKRGRERLTASFVFVAVGARPVAPDPFKVDGRRIHDSDTILGVPKLPRTLVVLGAGIIGCEYASMFSTAGTRVYLVDRRHEILASVDREIVKNLVERFAYQGMEIILEAEAKKIEPAGKGVRVSLSNSRKITADAVLIAQGRAGNIEGLGLAEAGVQHDERGIVKVDAHYRSNVPTVYAVGDVAGAPALASTSMEQGRIACCHAFRIADAAGGENGMKGLFPYGIYTIPEISMVGETEEQLASRKADFVTGKARYKELARGQIVGDRWGLLKLMVDRKTLKLLGVHILGDSAADLIHIGQAVMALNGDVNYFIGSVFNYPTLAEAYKTAAFHAVNLIKGVTRTR